MAESGKPDPVIAELLAASGIRHGFFTREGGVSSGIYRGLNVGIGSADDQGNVAENRSRVARWLGIAPDFLATPYQVHSPDVAVITAPFQGERPKVDAVVTNRPGLAIGVHTADCGPILFADAGAGVIGAAHAGWKGALTGVLENTIAAMETLGARRQSIKAVLGPSITKANYEVGPEFAARFAGGERWFTPSAKPGHSMFDLPGYTIERLRNAGVEAETLGLCTYPDEDRFFSYRRTTHRGEADYGRQVSAIILEE